MPDKPNILFIMADDPVDEQFGPVGETKCPRQGLLYWSDDGDLMATGLRGIAELAMATHACFGNSDGDREMLMWTMLGRDDNRPSSGIIVHHTDAEREFAYDRQHVLSGQLDKGLDETAGYDGVPADIKNDRNTVFPI